MKIFIQSVHAEMIKSRRTGYIRMLFAAPFAHIILFVVFNHVSGSNTGYDARFVNPITLYQVISWGCPLFVSCLATLLSDQEHIAGNYIELLANAYAKDRLFYAQAVLVILFCVIGMIILAAGVTLCLVLTHSLMPGHNFRVFLLCGITIAFSSLGTSAVQLYIAFARGRIASVAVGILGCFLSVLAWSSFGNIECNGVALWSIIPYGWGSRLVGALMSHCAYQNVTEPELSSIGCAIIMCSAFTVLAWAVFHFWSIQWEGPRNVD